MPLSFLKRLLHFKFEQLTFKPSIKLFAALKAKKLDRGKAIENYSLKVAMS